MNYKRSLLACLMLICSPCITLSQVKQLKVPDLAYERYTLPNGLEVILHQDRRLPIAAVSIHYHVGPRNEREGLTGFAHLFEHMMFQGSQHLGNKTYISYIEAAGGAQNGSTHVDHTGYYEFFPSNYMDLALWLESDRMGFLLDGLTQKKLDNQKDVVRNERRQRVENESYGLADEALVNNLYPIGHPYHANVIGSHADIESAKLGDVRDFFKQYYTPNNATLTIMGDFDQESVKKLISLYFGPIARGPEVQKVAVNPVKITEEKRITVTDTVQLQQIQLGWLTPARFTPGATDATTTAYILGGDNSSKLYRGLVYERQIAQAVSCVSQGAGLQSYLACKITARPGVTAQQLLEAANVVIDDFRKDGPTPEEIKRTRAHMVTERIELLQQPLYVAELMNTYNDYTETRIIFVKTFLIYKVLQCRVFATLPSSICKAASA